MGISFNGKGGNDFWQPYPKDLNIRSTAEQRVAGPKPEESSGTPTTTGVQAKSGQFDIALNGNAGTKPIRPDTQVASGGNQPLQRIFAGIGGEFTPPGGLYNNNWMKDYYA